MRGRHLLEYKKVLSMPTVRTGVDLFAASESLLTNKWINGTTVDFMRPLDDKRKNKTESVRKRRGVKGREEVCEDTTPLYLCDEATVNLNSCKNGMDSITGDWCGWKMDPLPSLDKGREQTMPLDKTTQYVPETRMNGRLNCKDDGSKEAASVVVDCRNDKLDRPPIYSHSRSGSHKVTDGTDGPSKESVIRDAGIHGNTTKETPNHVTRMRSMEVHKDPLCPSSHSTSYYGKLRKSTSKLIQGVHRHHSIEDGGSLDGRHANAFWSPILPCVGWPHRRLQIFNLPLPRLQVWLNSVDLNNILRMLRRYLNGDVDHEKVVKTLSIIDSKLDIDSRSACNAVSKILKIQYKALDKFNSTSVLHEPLYRRSIQALDMHIKWVKVDLFFDIIESLLHIWRIYDREGSLENLIAMHGMQGKTIEALCTPSLSFIECKIFDASPDSLECILRVISILSDHMGRDSLVNIHDIAFSKVREFSRRLSRREITQLLTILLSIESSLERPFLPLCKSLLTPRGNRNLVIDGKELMLILKGLSLSTSVDFSTSNTALGFVDLENDRLDIPENATKLSKTIAILLLRTFGIRPLSDNSIRLIGGWKKANDMTENQRVCKFREFDFKSNVVRMVKHLKGVKDPTVEMLTNPKWIKENCIVPSLKIDYLDILTDSEIAK